MVEKVTPGKFCGGKVALGEVCGGKSDTGRGLWWKRCTRRGLWCKSVTRIGFSPCKYIFLYHKLQLFLLTHYLHILSSVTDALKRQHPSAESFV